MGARTMSATFFPCPWCGSRVERLGDYHELSWRDRRSGEPVYKLRHYKVRCTKCGFWSYEPAGPLRESVTTTEGGVEARC